MQGRDALRNYAGGIVLAKAGSGSDRDKVARQSRMRWHHCEAAIYLQVAERLSLCRNNCKFAMGDTSSVCSADSFPSRGSLLTSASS